MSQDKAPETQKIQVRVSAEVRERIDALKPLFASEGHEGTRNDVLRALVLHGLEKAEHASRSRRGARQAMRTKPARSRRTSTKKP